MTFQDAKNFCKNHCTRLYVPTNYDTTWYGLALESYNNGIDVLHTGIQVHKNDSGEVFFTDDGVIDISKTCLNKFTDIYFFGVLSSREYGTYSLALDTMSKSRYNMWQSSDHDAKYYFACQSTDNQTHNGKCYEYGVSYESYDDIINNTKNVEDCNNHCLNSTSCVSWSHDQPKYKCFLRDSIDGLAITLNSSNMVSGPRVCSKKTSVEQSKALSKSFLETKTISITLENTYIHICILALSWIQRIQQQMEYVQSPKYFRHSLEISRFCFHSKIT